eukprot:scaffold2910_cov390-Prasinococcus_capsulatus_cf.AAC.23
MSRSGDECVVALTDQWYLLYGEEEWRDLTQQCVDQMNMYHDDARNSFNDCLTTLHQWACSRSFGLGTRLPWDEEFLIESLSDSTIYMAYYTFCHLLHEDMYGEQKLVQAQELTKEVWDYILLDGELPVSSAIGQERLQRMKREFDYWYPFDLRVSGKDLIRNHLTFCLYNHTAIFKADKCVVLGPRPHSLVSEQYLLRVVTCPGTVCVLSPQVAEGIPVQWALAAEL